MTAAYESKKSQLTKLGVQDDNVTQAQLDRLSQFGEYHYAVAPMTKMSSKAQEDRFHKLTAGTNGRTFNPDQMDLLRDRLTNLPRHQKHAENEAIIAVQIDLLGTHFLEVCEKEGVDHTYFEKMLYPKFLPPYECAAEALQLPTPPIWTRKKYSVSVNLCRLPLDRCDFDSATAKISTDEFIGLLYTNFVPVTLTHYYCSILGQKMVYTKQFIDEFGLHLLRDLHRIEKISGEKMEKNPILCISPLGKLGGLLNMQKTLPVPVVTVHNDPQVNPYLLHIPQSEQEKMKLFPVQKMTIEDAVKKYQPSIVIFGDMTANQDETTKVRSHGCVKQIFHTGMTDGSYEGHAFDTWGSLYYVDSKRKNKNEVFPKAPYELQGWKRFDLDHLSRWTIHKMDSPLCVGFGAVTCWTHGMYGYSLEDKAKFLMRRFVKRF